jgi:hypothetical protein
MALGSRVCIGRRSYFTYDTAVIISRKGKANIFLLSEVVLMQLTTSARDDSQRRIYERLFRDYLEDNSLIIPNEARLRLWDREVGITQAVGGKVKSKSLLIITVPALLTY